MSLPSSPLFDAPFAERTPLRRRENDSFATTFAATTTTSQEMPVRRRRRPPSSYNDTEQWIRFSMKAILLSPVVVLVIWSVVLATKSTSTSTNKNNTVVSTQPRGASQQHKNKIPIIAPLGDKQPVIVQPQQQQPQQPMYAMPNAAMMLPQQQQQVMGQSVQQQQQPVPMAPQQAVQYPIPQGVQPQQQQQQQQQFLLPQQQHVFQQQQGYQQQLQMPQQQAVQQQQQQQQMPQQQAVQQQQQQQMPQQQAQQAVQQQQEFPQQQQQQPLAQQQMPQQQQALPSLQQQQVFQPQQQQLPKPQQQQQQTAPVRYYYYDPSQTHRDTAGNLILPDTVYDAQGRSIPIAQLSSQQLQLQEPPKTVFHHDNFTNNSSIPQLNITYYHPNTVNTPVHDKHREFAMRTNNIIATTATLPADQSIIVGTVGIMALLVGALSARRLRSRGILQVCLDGAEDEVAYDAAYTSNATYGTWKGDLEKFDV